jgi:hypothetical protein
MRIGIGVHSGRNSGHGVSAGTARIQQLTRERDLTLLISRATRERAGERFRYTAVSDGQHDYVFIPVRRT